MKAVIGNRIVTYLAIFSAIILVVATSVYLFIQTDQGRQFAVRQIESLVHDPAGISISLGDLSGNLFSDFDISSISFSDSKGNWAAAENLKISWSPLGLLTGKLEIQDVSLQSFKVNRRPASGTDAPEQDTFSSFSLPVSIELDQLNIEKITLEEPVLGRAAQLNLSLELNTQVNDAIYSEIKISRLDGNTGSVEGLFSYHPEFRTLAIDVQMREPQGGLIARTLDLPGYPELTASLFGDGALNAWRGQFRMNADKVFESDLAISTRGETRIEIDVQGGGILAEDMTTSLPMVDGSYIGVEAAIAWDTTADKILINSSRIENTNLSIAVNGEVDFANDTLKGDLKSTLRDPSALNKIIAPASMESAVVDLKIDGTFREVTLDAIVQVGNAAYNDEIAANEATGTFSSNFNILELEEIPVSGSAAIAGISMLPPEIEALFGNAVDIDFSGVFERTNQKVDMADLKIAGENISAAGRGHYFMTNGTVDATADIKIQDLSKLLPVTGNLAATIDLKGMVPEQRFAAKVGLQATELDLQDQTLNDLIGSSASATAKIGLKNDTLNVSDIEAQLPVGVIAGEAEFPVTFETVLAKLVVSVPELSRLDPLTNAHLLGAGTITADFKGEIDNPRVTGNLEIKNLQAEEVVIGDTKANYTFKDILSAPTGDIAGVIDPENLNINFSSNVRVTNFEHLSFDQISIADNDNKMSGALNIPLNGSPLTGQLEILLPELATVAALIDEEISGSLKIEAVLENLNGEQGLAFDATSSTLTLPHYSVSIDGAQLKGKTSGNFADPAVKATVEINRLSVDKSELENAVVSIDGKVSDMIYDFKMENRTEPKLELEGGGAFSRKNNIAEFSLARLEGEFGGKKIALVDPLLLKQDKYNIDIERFTVAIGEGTLNGAAVITDSSATGKLSVVALPLDILELLNPEVQIAGRLDGDAQVSIQEKGSTGTFSFAATEIQVGAEEYPDTPVFSSHLKGTIAEGKIEFVSDITGLEKTAFEISGILPITATFTPFKTHINYDKPVNIKITADSNIKALWPILSLDTQRATGIFTAEADLRGTLSDPVLNGVATLKNGSYEHTEYGTVLSNIALELDVKDTNTIAVDLKATDGRKGTVASTGSINISAVDNPELDLSLLVTDLKALNLEELQVTTDADIEIKGTLAALNVVGKVTTSNVEIDIGGEVAPTVVNLKVTEVNRKGVAEESLLDKTDLDRNILLAIDLDMPRRVFIRGRGLDSEWEGKFKITGTAEKPVIEGYISPIRGQFVFAGKSFVLQEGEIALLGGNNLDPELSLSGKYENPNITATVTIEGPASDPEISFSSDEGLPEDEVISQILFGKASGGLTALEAVQLAETLATLSGSFGSGGGITGFVRNTLGVDVLSAGTNADTGAAEVSVGKYVNDNVYVGVDQGAEAGSTRAKVQIDLTPNLSLETEMGQTSDSRVGIFWKWDY